MYENNFPFMFENFLFCWPYVKQDLYWNPVYSLVLLLVQNYWILLPQEKVIVHNTERRGSVWGVYQRCFQYLPKFNSGIQLTTSPITRGYRTFCWAIQFFFLCSPVSYMKRDTLRSRFSSVFNRSLTHVDVILVLCSAAWLRWKLESW